MKLKQLRPTYNLLSCLALVLASVAILQIFPGMRTILVLTALLCIALSSYLDYQYWRCPKCHAHLGRKGKPERCPECGERIDYEANVSKQK